MSESTVVADPSSLAYAANAKPRIRVPAGSSARVISTAKSFVTQDSFQNFISQVGIGTNNQSSGSTYGFNPLSRNRLLLEWMYRGSWLVQQIVDAPADDMTREGIDILGETDAGKIADFNSAWSDLGIWEGLRSVTKWARLYGGALGYIMIDGQDPETPLRTSTIGKDQFKGLMVLDRWMVNPSFSDVVTDFGPDIGKPKFYRTVTDAQGIEQMHIHYSRVIRLEGIELPYYQRLAENGWGLSVMEPVYDRLVAFDSTTQGAAQLVYKAHLRTVRVKRLREVIAAGGPAYQSLLKMFEMVRMMQTNEGLTVLDADDEFDAHQYTFAGLSDVLLMFSEQLSGASQIPLVRLFGQAPAGLNSTGESDWRNYYDGIRAKQRSQLGRPVKLLMNVSHRSFFGKDAPDDFDFKFRPLYVLNDQERGELAERVAAAVGAVADSGIIDQPTALRELKQSSERTGIFTNITDELIAKAEEAPPEAEAAIGAPPGQTGEPDAPAATGEAQNTADPEAAKGAVKPPTLHINLPKATVPNKAAA